MIDKGKISTISADGRTATVVPDFDGDIVTVPLVIPSSLVGMLTVKMPVVYTTFPDNTGIILCRTDGEPGASGALGIEGLSVVNGLLCITYEE